MHKRNLLSLALGTAALVLSGFAAKAETLDNVKAKGVLTVAVMQDYPPYGSIGPDMQPMGIDIDVARYMADKLGVGLSLVPTNGANRVPFLQTGKADIILACLGKTAEREKVVSFSNAYIAEANAIFGPNDVKIASPADLSGRRIGVSRGGTEDLELTAVAPKDASIQRYEDTASTLAAYASGQVDMIATGTSTANAFNKNAPRKTAFKLKLAAEPAFVGVPKGDEPMLKTVNSMIAEMAANGKMAEIASKWLGDPSAANAGQ